jgi:hypothetical protein
MFYLTKCSLGLLFKKTRGILRYYLNPLTEEAIAILLYVLCSSLFVLRQNTCRFFSYFNKIYSHVLLGVLCVLMRADCRYFFPVSDFILVACDSP